VVVVDFLFKRKEEEEEKENSWLGYLKTPILPFLYVPFPFSFSPFRPSSDSDSEGGFVTKLLKTWEIPILFDRVEAFPQRESSNVFRGRSPGRLLRRRWTGAGTWSALTSLLNIYCFEEPGIKCSCKGIIWDEGENELSSGPPLAPFSKKTTFLYTFTEFGLERIGYFPNALDPGLNGKREREREIEGIIFLFLISFFWNYIKFNWIMIIQTELRIEDMNGVKMWHFVQKLWMSDDVDFSNHRHRA